VLSSSQLFIIEGAMTIGVAVIAMFILPDWPATTKWLTPRERALAVRRLARDAGGVEDETGSVWQGAKEALTDYKGELLVIDGFMEFNG
jgi:hypothetical protein